MKKLIIIAIVLSLLVISAPVFAARGTEKGASEVAMERASDKAIFHRVSDWFATVGKSEEEKAKIIAERDAKRAEERAKKEAEKAARKAEKEAEKAIKQLEKETEKSKAQVRERTEKSKREMEQAQEKIETESKSMKGMRQGK